MRIIVTGLIAQHYTLAGVSWDYIQYCIGLKQLGHDVYYFEDSGEWPYNLDGGISGNDWVEKDCFKNINYLKKLFDRYGLNDRWAYLFPLSGEWFGLSDEKRNEVLRTADMLINVSGALEKPEKYQSVKKLVYIDSDPGFTQVKLKKTKGDFAKRIGAHHCHFSFGEALPPFLKDELYDWKPTRTPIVLSEWDNKKVHQERYTTIMNWTSYKPLVFEGKSFHQKDVEFIRFIELKRKLKNISFEVALSKLQHKNWQSSLPDHFGGEENPDIIFSSPADLLSHYGWKVVDPAERCHDIDTYRDYIFSSKAEWSVAKGGYAISKPGWFSCRSACYLAAGRPVIVQDTGFSEVIPEGEGILAFNSMEEAIEKIMEVEADYSLHARRAREIAEEYFDAPKVLQQLIERVYSD
jgi:glycosyltransferase involved in cell wall biosynthesis